MRASDSQQAGLWSAIVTGSGTLTMQVTGVNSGSYLQIGIAEFSTGTTWEASRAEAGNKSYGTSAAANSGNATSAGEAVFVGQMLVDSTANPATVTEDAAFTLIHEEQNGSAHEVGSTIQQIVGTGTTDAASWTNPNNPWCALVQVFKPTAGAATKAPPFYARKFNTALFSM